MVYLIEINPTLAHVSANGLVVKYSFAIRLEISCAGGSIPPWRNVFACPVGRHVSPPALVRSVRDARPFCSFPCGRDERRKYRPHPAGDQRPGAV